MVGLIFGILRYIDLKEVFDRSVYKKHTLLKDHDAKIKRQT